MTRHITEKTKIAEYNRTSEALTPLSERMGIEEMLLGYTINGAIQLGVEDTKGSVTAGKDADFLFFDSDLTRAEKSGFSHNRPAEVYFAGKKMNEGVWPSVAHPYVCGNDGHGALADVSSGFLTPMDEAVLDRSFNPTKRGTSDGGPSLCCGNPLMAAATWGG